jgi:RimJ/RimL family protein N-acetyltransferase
MTQALVRLTHRLRLEPIGSRHSDDLLAIYRDPAVAEWYGEWTREQIDEEVARIAQAWLVAGVHKWMAYDRVTGERIGRGGLSRAHVDGRDRLEIGWALHHKFWHRGYATEIGRAGLAFAFNELDADEVVSFTETHNERSRAVMERLGFSYEKDIIIDGGTFALYAIDRPQTRSRAQIDPSAKLLDHRGSRKRA